MTTTSPSAYLVIRNINNFAPASGASETEQGEASTPKKDYEYKLSGVFVSAFMNGFGFLFAFICCFVGISISQGVNEALWTFLFLILSLIRFIDTLRSTPNKIQIRSADKTMVEFFSIFGKSLYGGEYPLSDTYESVAVKQTGKTESLILVRTDEHMQKMKETHKMCAKCIGKEYILKVKDLAKFRSDFDL